MKSAVNNKNDLSWIKSAHARAARAFLGWTLKQTKEKSGVAINVVSRFEREETNARASAKERLYTAYLAAGVEIVPDGLKVH